MRMIKACEVMQSLILLFLFAALSAQAAEPITAQTSDDELVKQSQNPLPTSSVCRCSITGTSPRVKNNRHDFTSAISSR